MGKNKVIKEVTNLLSRALRHKIGSIINHDELYAEKYEKDYQLLLGQALRIYLDHNWNNQDIKIIKEILSKKLKKELKEKDFIHDKKFEIMDEEIDKAMKELLDK